MRAARGWTFSCSGQAWLSLDSGAELAATRRSLHLSLRICKLGGALGSALRRSERSRAESAGLWPPGPPGRETSRQHASAVGARLPGRRTARPRGGGRRESCPANASHHGGTSCLQCRPLTSLQSVPRFPRVPQTPSPSPSPKSQFCEGEMVFLAPAQESSGFPRHASCSEERTSLVVDSVHPPSQKPILRPFKRDPSVEPNRWKQKTPKTTARRRDFWEPRVREGPERHDRATEQRWGGGLAPGGFLPAPRTLAGHSYRSRRGRSLTWTPRAVIVHPGSSRTPAGCLRDPERRSAAADRCCLGNLS